MLRQTALRSLFGSAFRKYRWSSRGFPQRGGRSMSRRSGHRFAVRTCDQEKETWLFENLDWRRRIL